MHTRAFARALARARRALDARVVRIARVVARPPDVESASHRALRTRAASDATLPWALRALVNERGSVASTAHGGATRAYSKKKGKKHGKEERVGATPSAANAGDDEDEEDGEDDDGDAYDPKAWQRCVRERVDVMR